ncbi:MAG: 1-acyl-sn-glycerol-3-phosphate acyltransferase [bacterium]|nr:1-acyl-sn-glycerol-3-phosphate acyltransferase [bacterium]
MCPEQSYPEVIAKPLPNSIVRAEAGGSVVTPWWTVTGWVRIVCRLAAMVLLTTGLYLALWCIVPVRLVSQAAYARIAHSIGGLWGFGITTIVGMRLKVVGKAPEPPFLLVANHVVWLDPFALNRVLPSVFVGMKEVSKFPVIGSFMRARNVIWVDRRNSDEVPRINARMSEAMAEGKGVMFFPEGIISPGRDVRRFRAALLQNAVDDQRPVHYATFTYTTPDGYPQPSESILYGPDPYFLTSKRELPQEELELWGPVKPVLPYVCRILSMPGFEAILTYGKTPVAADDRVELANKLQAAVRANLDPVP